MRFVCDSCRASYRISDDKVGPKGVKVRCQKCGFVILVRRPEEEPDEALMTQVMSNPLAPMDALEEGEASLSETPAPGGDLGDDLDAAFSFGDDAPQDTPAADAPSAEAPAGGAAEASPPQEEAPAAAEQTATSGGEPEGGLDPNALFGDDDEDEIGAIFDSVLNSGSHALPGAEDDPSQVATKTLDVASMARAMDQSVASEESEKHELTPALPSNEWFVAIEENQVGPVGIDVLKEHWDRGEIGPDSLCWRAGMADWIPLSEVTELQRHLAPKPSKPAIVSPSPAPAAVAGAAAAASGAAEGAAAGGWKPSAASALASLVKDELEVISRPAPTKKPESGSGLLDVPPVASEPVSSPGAPAASASASMNLPLGASAAASEPLSVPAAPAAAPYPDIPAYQTLPPVQQKKPMGLWIGVGALVVLLLGGGAFFLFGRGDGQVNQAPTQTAQAPAPDAAALAQAEAEKKAAEEAAAKKAAEEAEKAALAKAEEEKKKAEEEAAKKAEEEAELAAAEGEDEEEEKTVARRTTRRRTTRRATRPTPTRAPTPSRSTATASSSSGSSDPFDDIFGPSNDSGSSSARSDSRPATYVPPAPSSIPAELSSSDIAQAVVAKRNELNGCVQRAKAADPSLGSGRMAMRWTIETSGRVSGLSNQTAEIRGSQLDKCVSGVIQKITFPRHRKAGGQVVTFPITF